MNGSKDFKDLESYFEAIRNSVKKAGMGDQGQIESDIAIIDLGIYSDGLFNIYTIAKDTTPKITDNLNEFSEQVFDFVFSTGKESFDNLSNKGINFETKFFSCILKYLAINSKFKNTGFSGDLKNEMEMLDKFFIDKVVPGYKTDTESKNKILSSSQDGGYEFLLQNIFLALRCEDNYNSKFIENMLDAVPEFLGNQKVNFQGTDIINQLVSGNGNYHCELAEKLIDNYPENIYSFCSTVYSDKNQYSENIEKKGMDGTLFDDFALIGDDGKIDFYEKRCEPNFLSNVIGLMHNNDISSELKDKANRLFFHTMDVLNKFIEANKDKKDILKAIDYHLNCKVTVNGVTMVPIDVIRDIARRNNSAKSGILKKSLKLLNSEHIKLKTIEELRMNKFNSELVKLESRLTDIKSKRDNLEAAIVENRAKLKKASNVGIRKKIINLVLEFFNRVFRTKFNTIRRKKQIIKNEIAKIKEQRCVNEQEHSKTQKLIDVIDRNKKSSGKNVKRSKKEISDNTQSRSSTTKILNA
ncbi:MAG: hypothetical protein LBP39_03720 [Rickettsiales bacterium]|jgi:hypothetical protein|nr:hypothetical protein [Rickettsiales bacterium]